MATVTTDLWGLVKFRPEVDPDDLAAALCHQLGEQNLDYRTRLLIRDSATALRKYWGEERYQNWLAHCADRSRIEAICREDFERPGFPSLERRLMKKTDPEDIRRYLRELGTKVHHPLKLYVGGSTVFLLPGLLSRFTDDIDVVDEVPEELRSQHALLQDLETRYGLKLAHFQRHYLPMGWENRLHFLDYFGALEVHLVDGYDVFLSKLFSIRGKDLDDMRILAPQLDKDTLSQRLKDTASMLASESLRQRAENNWYILFGEKLPT